MRSAVRDPQQYPDYASFSDEVARFVGVAPGNMVLGLGIEGLVRDLMMLCLDPGDTVAFVWPTCAMFGVYAQVFGARTSRIVFEPGQVPTVDDVVRHVRRGETRLVLLANPGQPVDYAMEPEEIAMVAHRCRAVGAVLAVDEAYFGFGAPTFLDDVYAHDNVVVLRTFSKALGGAGLRIGMAVGSGPVIRALEAVRASGEVAGPSMAMARVIMARMADVVVPSVRAIIGGRDWVRGQLDAYGLVARGRWANHVLVRLADPMRVATRLRTRGVHVRADMPEPLQGHMLVTCGSVETMRRFDVEFRRALMDG